MKMMIIVSTQSKVSSSFQFLLARNYSTQESLLVQLSADIDFIYNDYATNYEFHISLNRLANIQEQIFNKSDLFHPLEFRIIKKVYIYQFILDTIPDCPDMIYGTTDSDPDIVNVFKPNNADVLVFMGLSLMLFRLSCGGNRIDYQHESFYKSLQDKMGKVDRLYRIDLMPSRAKLPKSLVLEMVLPYVGEGYVYKLISAILDLPIIDEYGNRRISHGIPPVGELTKVLLNIVLMNIFDRQFPKGYPGISFHRSYNEVFISTRVNDEVVFDQKVGYDLLEELSLGGLIASIGPGDDPIKCEDGWLIYLDNDGTVVPCTYEEFYGL